MKKIKSRRKLFLYGCSGMGVNMMNLVVGSYLCSALITGGFAEEDVGFWTYTDKTLVVATLWMALSFVARVLDGVIDLPFASFTDRLKTRWGRRRPSLVIGYIPMVIAYLLFLIPLNQGETVLNTVWFGGLLMVFYAFYTLTMLTYYATFSEVTETEGDVVFLSNVKSVYDVVYFILGYALLPVFVSLGINIRYVALIFLPLSFLMVIPLFLLKEEPTNKPTPAGGVSVDKLPAEKSLTLWKAIAVSLKNRNFIYWMCTAAVMNFGLQLFLGGINELFSTTGLNMTVVMASSFVPVPLTIILYNKIVSKKGLGFGYRYILTIFAIGMLVMYFCNINSHNMTKSALTAVAIVGGIFVSFSIGAFFSVTYTVPTHLAKIEREEKGISVASMYFAVQGLFEGVSAGLATGVMLTALKSEDMIGNISYLPLIVAASCLAAFLMSLAFPKVISHMGKASPKAEVEAETYDLL